MHSLIHTSRRGMTLRTTGIFVSLGALAIILTVVGVTAMRAAQRNVQSRQSGQEGIEPAVLPTNQQPVATGEIMPLIREGSQGVIQLVNEDNVVVQEMLYDTFNPLEAGRYHVTLPQAWLYMADGSSISIHANELNYVQPSGNQEPEKGRFAGNVRIRIFEARDPQGNAAPRAGDDLDVLDIQHFALVETESLTFDSAIGELSTGDAVRITSAGIDAQFVGLTIVADERNKRLAYLEAHRDGKVVIDPAALQSMQRERAAASQADDESASPASAPLEQQYHIEFADHVRMFTAMQTLDADRLHVWALLLDGSLPEGAIAPLTIASSTPSQTNPSSNTTSDAKTTESELITVTWTGPLTVRPLDDDIDELQHDAVAIRLESPESGVVAIRDDDTGATMQAVALTYGMTTRNASLIGAGQAGVRIQLPGQADVLVGRLDANLTTGKAVVNGPGEIRAIDSNNNILLDQRIAWQQGGEFVLATRNGQVDIADPMLLREALLTGAAEARRGDRAVRGEIIRAWFGLTDTDEASINRLLVEGNAHADAGPDGQLTARRIDVTFDPASTLASPSPTKLVATGAVRGSQGDSLVESELLEATLGVDAQGRPIVQDVHASLAVNVRTPQGDEVTAEELHASFTEGIYDMTGQPVVLRRDAVSVSGSSIRLEEPTQRMTVFGAGVLQSTQRTETGAGYEQMQISWEESMLYDGIAGIAEFIGNCQAQAQLNNAKDIAQAQRIVVKLEPSVSTDDTNDTNEASNARDVVRTVLLYGALHEGVGEQLVTIESRRYTPDPARESGVRLEGLLYLESEHIEADVQTDTLRVPQQGKLLIENRSAQAPQPENTPNDTPESLPFDGQGTTLFTWEGDMELRRAESTAILREGVQLRHLPPGGSTVTELECEVLNATVDLPGSPGTVGLERTQLRTARASGAVYVRRDTKQLIADTLVYDATQGIAQATASLGNVVTMFDAQHPTPLTGTLLRWDVIRDRVEWRGAGETTVPRN